MSTVLLVGMGPTALSALESLRATCSVVGVVRDISSGDDEVARRAAELDVPVFADVAPAALERLVEQLEPDCLVVSSYNRILRPRLLRRLPCINVHYAPLPRYRGRANVNWAVINDEPETAITVHMVAPDLDAGNIVFQQRVPIGERDTVGALYRKLNAIQRQHLGAAVVRVLNGFAGEPQQEQHATYGCSRVPQDGLIHWDASSRAIDCLIRGLGEPYPGAWTYVSGSRLTVWRAEPLADAPRYVGRVPGRVVQVDRANGWVDVLTGDGVLRLFEVQREDEPIVAASEVITSVRATLGLDVGDLMARIEQLEHALAELTARAEALNI